MVTAIILCLACPSLGSPPTLLSNLSGTRSESGCLSSFRTVKINSILKFIYVEESKILVKIDEDYRWLSSSDGCDALVLLFSCFSKSRMYMKGFSELKEISTVPMLH